jgi:uncharacterized protein (TIGR01777 family)
MRIVIAGGSGLIGRAVAADLAAAGHEIVVLSRDPARHGALPQGVRAERWDGRSAAGWAALLDREAAILNLAGEGIAAGRWTAERKRRIRASREESSRAVVEAVRQAAVRPRVLLQGSAVGYYGPTGDEPVTENHPPGDDFLAETCAAWEAASAEVESLGVRRVLLRTGIVLARAGGALPQMVRPFRLGLGGPLGGGRQWMPWIHLADEVEAIRFLLEHDGASGPWNLTAPHPVTNRDFSRALAKALHRPSLLPAPRLALRLLLGEMSDMLLHGQRGLPRRLLDAHYLFRFPNLEPALRDLLD